MTMRGMGEYRSRFIDASHGALLLGPVGVGKTHVACALGHRAIGRRRGEHMARADKRLKAARLDNTSNCTPDEWLSMMADPLLAQSAVDRPVSTAHEFVIEGPSYRQRQKP